jgi:hypothetical protein
MMTESRSNPDWRPLALGLVLVTALYAVLYRFIPYDKQAYCLWPFCALTLYSGARLRWWHALAVVFAVMGATDMTFYLKTGFAPARTTYATFAALVGLGVLIRPFLQRNRVIAILGVGASSVIAYAIFFLATNTASWLGNALPEYSPHTFDTLMLSYRNGLEFIRSRPGEVFGSPICVGLVFGAHALLARAYFPAEKFGVEQAR